MSVSGSNHISMIRNLRFDHYITVYWTVSPNLPISPFNPDFWPQCAQPHFYESSNTTGNSSGWYQWYLWHQWFQGSQNHEKFIAITSFCNAVQIFHINILLVPSLLVRISMNLFACYMSHSLHKSEKI